MSRMAERSREMINCPHCQQTMSGSIEMKGQMLACAFCRQPFIIPDTSVRFKASEKQSIRRGGKHTKRLKGQYYIYGENGCPYIIPRPARPAGVTFIAALGLVFSGFMLLGGLIFILGNYFSLPELKTNIVSEKEMGVFCGTVTIFLLICVGLLRGSKSAYWCYLLLSLLNAVGIILNISPRQLGNNRELAVAENIYSGFILLYLVVGIIYLRTKRVRDWLK